MNKELVKAEAQDPSNYTAGHKFAPGNTLCKNALRGKQKIANACYQRALEYLAGDTEEQTGDDCNPLIQIMIIAKDTKDPELALKAWDKLGRFFFGTKSNVNLDLGADATTDEQAERTKRLFLALGVER
jgi:hypothetical protein